MIDRRPAVSPNETVLRRAPLLAIACLLALPASAWASLPGTPTISVGTTTACNTTGTRGAATDTCTYSGTQLALNGWTLKDSECEVAGTFTDTADTFKRHLVFDSTSYEFTANRSYLASTPMPIVGIDFQITCPLTWTGGVGLSWGKAITGGTPSDPVYTLHVRNRTSHSRLVHCRVSYQNDLNQTRFYTWSPTVHGDGLATTQIKVWRVNNMHCSYTLTRKLLASGTA